MTRPDTAAEALGVADPKVRTSGLAILREGRLHITECRPQVGLVTPAVVEAIVYGHSGDHVIAYEHGKGWWCGCRTFQGDGNLTAGKVCAHVYAAEVVTHAVGEPGKGRP